jgi:hypothetical protein
MRRRRIPPLLRDALRGRRSPLLPHGDTFLRGLALGAFVGAAIAGSTIWNRIRQRSRPTSSGVNDGNPSAPVASSVTTNGGR